MALAFGARVIVISYVRSVSSSAVTDTAIVFAPTESATAGEADPLATDFPFTFKLAWDSLTAAVT
jgi:hypothetical protein